MKSVDIEDFSFDDFLTDMVHDSPADMMHYIYDLFKDSDPSSLVNFQITFVLDTNILFPAIRNKVLSGDQTFVEKLIENPSLRICAPAQLETEIMAKIQQKFPKDKKTKNVKIIKAQQIAREILKKVEIIEDIDAESLEKANVELANRDPDDAPFMALCFSIKASGILTDDKDLKENDSVRTWNTREAGRIVTVLNKGTLCFAIATGSISFMVMLAKEILSAIWAILTSLLVKTTHLIKCGVQLAEKHPIILALIAAGLIIFDVKTGYIRTITKKFSEMLQKIGEILWHMLQIIRDLSGKTIKGYGVLLEYHQKACDEIALITAGLTD